MKRFNLVFAVVVGAFALATGFTACQSQPGTEASAIVAPQTPNEWMAFVTTMATGARTSATSLLTAAKITPQQAAKVNSLADTAESTVSSYLNAASTPGATPSVAAMEAAVTALTTYLASIQVPPK